MINTLKDMQMKNVYVIPELTVRLVTPGSCLLTSGENLNSRTYGSNASEETDDFWV